MAKGFPTLTTPIRPFPSVNSPMYKQVILPAEQLSTLITSVRSHSSVSSPVRNEARALPVGLPTFPTCIRLLRSVNSQMITEAVARAKRLPTFTAHIAAFPTEGPLVLDTCLLVAESVHEFTPAGTACYAVEGLTFLSGMRGLLLEDS